MAVPEPIAILSLCCRRLCLRKEHGDVAGVWSSPLCIFPNAKECGLFKWTMPLRKEGRKVSLGSSRIVLADMINEGRKWEAALFFFLVVEEWIHRPSRLNIVMTRLKSDGIVIRESRFFCDVMFSGHDNTQTRKAGAIDACQMLCLTVSIGVSEPVSFVLFFPLSLLLFCV
ncbi:hypothetical protein CBR_g30363 [Chara braunii]|uniref:Uncharacterized protein n=1 Tax=Chara braunii TaxID=69332 RepID=A0A388JX82_CHABU|nr:hypothetical protein CBR_g30363 [Chara braunii]|eukprot:GBG62409.1 hypothetical protein CBR_g30363 [Chara braunii]